MISKNIPIEFCDAVRTTWKLTFQDINKTPIEPKKEPGCSRRQLSFAIIVARTDLGPELV